MLGLGDDYPKDGEVMFAMEAVTNGWVALGFTEVAGEMNPSDTVIGWIRDGDGEWNVSPYRVKVGRKQHPCALQVLFYFYR